MQYRDREHLNLTVDDETRETLNEISKEVNMSISKVVDLMARFWRDMTFDEETLPVVNLLREKLGKKPLRRKYRSYKDIWKS